MPGMMLGAGVLGACVGAAAVYGYMQKRPEGASGGSVQPILHQSRLHPTFKYGIPIKERIREFTGYTACFDPATRNPAWVLERITKDSVRGEGKRAEQFIEDKVIPERFRSKLSDFHRSGYDRGHMAPALNHKSSQQDMDDTFFLTNMSPQVGDGFNRDYWARFERWARGIIRRADEVYIATGPVFAPKFTPDGLRSDHGYIGTPPTAVAVPTHYFKVVLAEFSDDKGDQRIAVGAFAMPNRKIPHDTPLASFAVPLELLESLTGIEFFPRAISDSQRRGLDAAAADWRKLGMAQQQALAIEGSKQYLESLPGELKRDLVPANNLPATSELSKVGVTAGPPAHRPRRTRGAGPAVHLCERVWCEMKPDKYKK